MIHTVYHPTSHNEIKNNRSKHKMPLNQELRSIYHAIIKINKQSPVYMFQLTKANQDYVVSLKDAAISLSTSLSKYTNTGKENIFHYKKLSTDLDSSIQARIIQGQQKQLPKPFSIKVEQVATPQVNLSNRVPASNKSLAPGSYLFHCTINENLYEFHYNVTKDSTNQENLTKLSNFINQSNIGLSTRIVSNTSDGTVQLELSSISTGNNNIFTFTDSNEDPKLRGIVEYYGFDQISKPARNCIYQLNEEQQESSVNFLTYHHSIHIDLLSVSEDTVSVSYIPDVEQIYKELSLSLNVYHDFIHVIANHKPKQNTSHFLLNELKQTYYNFKNELESCGLILDESHHFQVDMNLLSSAVNDGTLENILTSKNGYCSRLEQKANCIILNPMNYLDKVVVSYPNTNKFSYSNYYISSMYSGMLYNYYC